MIKVKKQSETQGKSNKKKAWIIILIPDKLKSGVKRINQDKGGDYAGLKGTFFFKEI